MNKKNSFDPQQKIYTFESEVRHPGIWLPVRSTFIKTNAGNILISPIAEIEQYADFLNSLGGVQFIVAPNKLHHLSFQKAVQLFPQAQRWGVPGLAKKRTDISWDFTFQKDFDFTHWPGEDELEFLMIEGLPAFNEVVFFHNESKTLIATDLCFNIHRPKGWAAGLILRYLGIYKTFGVNRWVKKYLKDRTAFMTSLTFLFEWDFENIIMAHGDLIKENGHTMLLAAYQKAGLI